MAHKDTAHTATTIHICIVIATLTIIPAVILLHTTWFNTGLPQGDGVIQALFTPLYFIDGQTIFEKLQNTWWTYFQQRAFLPKLIELSMYGLTGHIDIQVLGIISISFLYGIISLCGLSIKKYHIPIGCVAIASLMILSLYPHTVITWPECGIFYFGTLFFATLCFFFLDHKKPKISLALLCSWIATFTMANGILSVAIGSLIVLYQHFYRQPYTRKQLAFWFLGVLACTTLHLATMNVFSTDLYGAKSLEESFVNTGGRLIDFLESMGAAPFFPNEFREGKIILGCIVLMLMASLYLGKKPIPLTITGLMLFSTSTIFLTSLFRYSAGGNDGYQIFTATSIATTLITAIHNTTDNKNKILTFFSVVAAMAFYSNSLANISIMSEKNKANTQKLELLLTTGYSKKIDNWVKVILNESIEKNIFRPLQDYRSLNNVYQISPINSCPYSSSEQTTAIQQKSSNQAIATKLSAQIPYAASDISNSFFLCSNKKNYVIKMSRNNVIDKTAQQAYIEALLDKRLIQPNLYTVFFVADKRPIASSQPLNVSDITPPYSAEWNCKIMTKTFSFKEKAFRPLIQYYCRSL
jgi:hypothetical protein